MILGAEMLEYERVFMLQSCHFNGSEVYAAFHAAQGLAGAKDYEGAYQMLCARVLPNIHGHNFEVRVTISGNPSALGSRAYFVDDKVLAALVEGWNNTNLSVLPEFLNDSVRATTEQMAVRLQKKIVSEFGSAWSYLDEMSVRVQVRETPSVAARC